MASTKVSAKQHSNTKQHYVSHTSSSYESAFFYSAGDYTQNLRNVVRSALMIVEDNNTKATDDTANTNHQNNWKNLTQIESSHFHNPNIFAENHVRLMDIGGGTGNFTKMLVEHTASMDAVVIDPYLTATENNNNDTTKNLRADHSTNDIISFQNKNQICFVKAGAEDFIHSDNNNNNDNDKTHSSIEWWKKDYHQCLMKEVVHHLSANERIPIFKGIYSSLLPTSNLSHNQTKSFLSQQTSTSSTSNPPSILIVTRPQRNIDYPLWPAAQEIWALNQPSEEDIMNDLQIAGFKNVECTLQSYECNIALDTWCSMIQNRFWSTFTNFTNNELKKACLFIKEKYGHVQQGDEKEEKGTRMDETITFEDRLLFIKGYKLD